MTPNITVLKNQFHDAKADFLGRCFNIGNISDNLQEVVSIEEVIHHA